MEWPYRGLLCRAMSFDSLLFRTDSTLPCLTVFLTILSPMTPLIDDLTMARPNQERGVRPVYESLSFFLSFDHSFRSPTRDSRRLRPLSSISPSSADSGAAHLTHSVKHIVIAGTADGSRTKEGLFGWPMANDWTHGDTEYKVSQGEKRDGAVTQ